MATTEKLEVKILVLDDERLIRLTLCARLKQAGYDAIAVATVDEAVALLKKAHWMFNAIISENQEKTNPSLFILDMQTAINLSKIILEFSKHIRRPARYRSGVEIR